MPLESDDFQYHSSEQKKSPHLSHRGLTIMLSFMCLVPVMTILVLWNYLPPVFEGQLTKHWYLQYKMLPDSVSAACPG